MKTIWKFPLSVDRPKFQLDLPFDAKVVKVSHGYMWIEGSFNLKTLYPSTFEIIGTGHPVAEGEYIGTYFDGVFVWHVYMKRE